MPSPHAEYRSRPGSTTTSTFHSPPTSTTQASVSAWLEWETAMQWISGCLVENLVRRRKVFSATVHSGLVFSDGVRMRD
jgi:hypothetical protein